MVSPISLTHAGRLGAAPVATGATFATGASSVSPCQRVVWSTRVSDDVTVLVARPGDRAVSRGGRAATRDGWNTVWTTVYLREQ